MGDHRKLRRARGLVVRIGGGKRQKSGVLDVSGSARELNRAARKTMRATARRRMFLASIVATLIVAASVTVWILLANRPSEQTTEPVTSSASGASLLVAVTDTDGNAVSMILFGAGQEGATAALFPPGLLTVLPGFGDRQISDVTRFGDQRLPGLTVSNLLGIRLDATVQIGASDLANLVGSDVRVELASPLVEAQGDTELITMDVGSASRTPAEVAKLLTDQGTGTQLEWLDRQGSVWRALLGWAHTHPQFVDGLLTGASGDPTLARDALLTAAGNSDLQFTAVPAERIERAGGDSELYQISGDAATAFAAERFPYLQFTTGVRPRVEILNGNGRIGTTRPVAAALIEHGFRVVRTDNADKSTYEETRIIAQGRSNQQAALQARDVLGRGEVLVEVRQPSGVVDLTIIVGQDIPAQEA